MELDITKLFRIYITEDIVEPSIDIRFFNDIVLIHGSIRKKTKPFTLITNECNIPIPYEKNTTYNLLDTYYIDDSIFRNGEIVFKIKINSDQNVYFRVAKYAPICKYKNNVVEILIDNPNNGKYDIFYNKTNKKIESSFSVLN
jgi:hypothetical protein